MTNEIRTTGEISEMAYGITYPSLTFEFLVDNEFGARKFFEDWLDKVFNRTTRTVGYYNDYVKQIDLIVLDRHEDPIYSIRLHQAYPKSVNSMEFSDSGQDFIRCIVEMNYKFWERNTLNKSGSVDSTNSPFNESAADLAKASAPGNTAPDLTSMISTPFGSNLKQDLTTFGNKMGSELTRLSNITSALYTSSGFVLPGDPTFGIVFGNYSKTLGQNMGAFGSNISALTPNLGSITSIAPTLGSNLVAASNTIQNMGTRLASGGVPNSLTAIASNLKTQASNISNSTQVKSILNSLSSTGANMGAAGAEFKALASYLKANTSSSLASTNSLNALGSAFSRHGSDLTSIANNEQ